MLNLPLKEEDAKILENTKLDLEKKMDERTLGLMFRSKARWYEHGEKSSKYFFNLEKTKYNAKTCFSMFKNNQQVTQDPKEILEIAKNFYQELYSEEKDVKFDLENTSKIRVPEAIKQQQKPLNLVFLCMCINKVKTMYQCEGQIKVNLRVKLCNCSDLMYSYARGLFWTEMSSCIMIVRFH